MSLTLKETQALSEISQFIYPFLPGNPHPYADKQISFMGIAYSLHLGNYWQSGSKLPAINALLENTLDKKREIFCTLVLEIVRRGVKYCSSKGQPITKEQIQKLNKMLLNVDFKIPELWDSSFLDSLPSDIPHSGKSQATIDTIALKELKDSFMNLQNLSSPQKGFEFERILNRLFELFNLQPHSPFKLQGEQIDGSLELEAQTYLIEAKFQSSSVGQSDLLIFRGKIEAKSTWSRGIFISASGFTDDGLIAFSKGRPTNLIAFNGQDIYFILDGKIRLEETIKLKARRAAETGEVLVPVYELILEQ